MKVVLSANSEEKSALETLKNQPICYAVHGAQKFDPLAMLKHYVGTIGESLEAPCSAV